MEVRLRKERYYTPIKIVRGRWQMGVANEIRRALYNETLEIW